MSTTTTVDHIVKGRAGAGVREDPDAYKTFILVIGGKLQGRVTVVDVRDGNVRVCYRQDNGLLQMLMMSHDSIDLDEEAAKRFDNLARFIADNRASQTIRKARPARIELATSKTFPVVPISLKPGPVPIRSKGYLKRFAEIMRARGWKVDGAL